MERFHDIPPSALPSACTTKHVFAPLHRAHCAPRTHGNTITSHSTERIVLRGYNETRIHATLTSALPSADRRNHVSTPVHRAQCPPRIQRTMFPRHSTERIAHHGYKEPCFHATPPCALPCAHTRNHVSTPLHRANCPPHIQGTTFPGHTTERIALLGCKETRVHATLPSALLSADAKNHVFMPHHRANCPPLIQGNTYLRHSTERIALRGYKEPRFHAPPPNTLSFANTK